jgi:hypothetical protein
MTTGRINQVTNTKNPRFDIFYNNAATKNQQSVSGVKV